MSIDFNEWKQQAFSECWLECNDTCSLYPIMQGQNRYTMYMEWNLKADTNWCEQSGRENTHIIMEKIWLQYHFIGY